MVTGIVLYIILLFVFIFLSEYMLCHEDKRYNTETYSNRRLFNLNELTYFKIVNGEYSITYCKALRHENHKYEYNSYYYLYYESIRKDIQHNEYSFNSNDYTIIKNADAIVCSERDNFLNNAIPITEKEYKKIKEEFVKSIKL